MNVAMAKIKTIEIDGFLGEGRLVWDLDPDVNILGGKNGGGKSTVLNMCYNLLSSDGIESGLTTRYKKLCSAITITLCNGWKVCWPGGQGFILGLKDQTVKHPLSISDENGQKRSYQELREHIDIRMVNSFEQHVEEVKKYDTQQTFQDLKNPTMLDIMIQDQINVRNKNIAETMEKFMDNPDMDAQKQFSSMTREVYSEIEEFFESYEGNLNSKFEFHRNGQTFGFEALSMGEKQILLLFLTVCNMNHKECIMLMDEPDLSMHVDWKKKLVTSLNKLNPNMQLIITTHAPSLIRGWYDKVKEMDQLIMR